jgi:hypothetical protein
LQTYGIRIGEGVFYIANSQEFIALRFQSTAWRRPSQLWLQLPGAQNAKPMKFGKHASRCVELPLSYLEPRL